MSLALIGPRSRTCSSTRATSSGRSSLHAAHPAPGVVGGAVHAPAQVRLQAHRQQRGLVAPVLEQPSRGVVGEPVERLDRVGAEAREGGQVVRALEDVDRVDLHDAEALDQRAQLAGAGRRVGPRGGESGRAESDAAGLGGAEALAATGERGSRTHRMRWSQGARAVAAPSRSDTRAGRPGASAARLARVPRRDELVVPRPGRQAPAGRRRRQRGRDRTRLPVPARPLPGDVQRHPPAADRAGALPQADLHRLRPRRFDRAAVRARGHDHRLGPGSRHLRRRGRARVRLRARHRGGRRRGAAAALAGRAADRLRRPDRHLHAGLRHLHGRDLRVRAVDRRTGPALLRRPARLRADPGQPARVGAQPDRAVDRGRPAARRDQHAPHARRPAGRASAPTSSAPRRRRACRRGS